MPGFTVALACSFGLMGSVACDLSEGAPRLQVRLEQVPGPQPPGQDDNVARLRADLELPGPEARTKREKAIAQLLSSRDPRAHRVLQERIRPGADSEDVAATILAQLGDRLSNPADPVFGGDTRAARALRAAFLPSVIAVVGSAIAETPVTVVANGRRVLRNAESWERVPVFREQLRAADIKVRLAAARAAGVCRDLSLARELAAHIEDAVPDMRAAVADSLWHLTFHHGGFGTRMEFDAWFAGVADQRFVDLADEAALSARRELRDERRQHTEQVQGLVVELVESYASRREIQWAKIRAHALGADAATTAACLDRLRTLLRGMESLTGDAAERLALLDALEKRIDTGRDPRQRALLVEVSAYLVTPSEKDRWTRTMAHLLETLTAKSSSEVQIAALCGLRRAPSGAHRAAVVEAARRAVAAKDVALLAAAVQTLGAPRWTAPSPEDAGDRVQWLAVVRDALTDGSLPFDLRRQALALVDLRDGAQARIDEGFDMLHDLVRAADQAVSLRQLALLQLGPHTVGVARAERYVELLITCLSDGEPELRAQAARLVPRRPPEVTEQTARAWTARLIDAGQERLLAETDEAVHAAVADAMKQLAQTRGVAAEVIEKLSETIEKLATGARDKPFRAQHAAGALRIVASNSDRTLDEWVPACEALLKLDRLEAVRSILDRQTGNGQLEQPGIAGKMLQRVRLLRVQAAGLASDTTVWTDPANVAQADAVLAAATELRRANLLPRSSATTLLLMQIHGDRAAKTGDRAAHEQVVKLADTLPKNGDNPLALAARKHAALLTARSHAALDQPASAFAWLQPLMRNGPPGAEVLALVHRVGAALAKDPKEVASAVEALQALVQRTPDADPALPERVLLLGETLINADPANAVAVRQMLDARPGLFAAGKVGKALASRHAKLRQRVSGS